MLDEAGLETTLDWYIPTVERQTGIAISYEKQGAPFPVNGSAAVQIYRVLQEALNNVARHSGAKQACGAIAIFAGHAGTGSGGSWRRFQRTARKARDWLGCDARTCGVDRRADCIFHSGGQAERCVQMIVPRDGDRRLSRETGIEAG